MVLEILTTSWQATAFRIGPRKTRSPPGWSLNFVVCKPVVKTASSPGNSTQWAKRANFTDCGRFLAQQIEIRSIEAVECNTTNQHFLPGLPNFMDRTNKTNLQSIYNRVTTLAKQRLAGLSRNTELDYCESYLFRNDHACGVKITAGPFTAKWYESNDEIEFFRGVTPLGTVSIHGDRGSKAA